MFRILVSTRARVPIEYIVIPLVRGRGVPAHEGRTPRPDGEIPVRLGQRCVEGMASFFQRRRWH